MFETALALERPADQDGKLGPVALALGAHALVVSALVAASWLVLGPPPSATGLPTVFVFTPPPPPAGPAPRLPAATPDPARGSRPSPLRDLVQPRPDAPEPRLEQPTVGESHAVDNRASDGVPGGIPFGSPDGTPGGDGTGVPGGGGPGFDRGESTPLEVGGAVEAPVLLIRVSPGYPETARRAGLQGRVVLRAVIGLDGGVEDVRVASATSPLFEDSAREAVRRWKYRPARAGGEPVRVYLTVTVDFRLR